MGFDADVAATLAGHPRRTKDLVDKLETLRHQVTRTEREIEEMHASLPLFQQLVDHPFVRGIAGLTAGPGNDGYLSGDHGFYIKHSAFRVDVFGNSFLVDCPFCSPYRRVLSTHNVDRVILMLQKILHLDAAIGALPECDPSHKI